MASHNRVPSRAAINALRGVVLTTSCSVVLLAEERRRRIKLARAAIENARKLHTVKSNRGPIALTDGLGAWESRLSDEILSMPTASSMKSYRRRRRSTTAEDLFDDALNIHRHNETREATTTAREVETTKIPSLRELVSRSDRATKNDIQKSEKLSAKTQEQAKRADILTTLEVLALSAESESKAESASLTSATRNARNYILATSGLATPAQPRYRDAVAVLNELLDSLHNSRLDAMERLERFELATAVLQRVSSFGAPTQNTASQLQKSGLRLLTYSALSSSGKMDIALDVQLPLHPNKASLVSRFISILMKDGKPEDIKRFLQILHNRDLSCSWHKGHLMCLAIERQIKIRGYEQAKAFFISIKDAGLFKDCGVSSSIEYKIRRLIILEGLKAGDAKWVATEMQELCEVDDAAARVDVGLQGGIIMQDAAFGKWDSVRDGIQKLGKILETISEPWQRMLGHIADLYAQVHGTRELEAWLKEMPVQFGVKLRQSWVKAVLEEHAKKHELVEMSEWLEFCSRRGLDLDYTYVQQLCQSCRQDWGFDDKALSRIRETMQDYTSLNSNAWDKVLRDRADTTIADPAKELRSAIYSKIEEDGGRAEGAFSLIEEAHARGEDITEALTPALMAELDAGRDAATLVNEALRRGAQVHDKVYNKAAQSLSSQRDLRGAVAMCKLAAEENGKGNLLYNEYNFANMIFAYTGLAQYEALSSLLQQFTSTVEVWRGSKTCKESIKRAMKTAAMRGTQCDKSSSRKHVQALDELDAALMHVKKCRADHVERRAVTEASVKVFRPTATKESTMATGRKLNGVVDEAVVDEYVMRARAEAV